MKLRVQIPAHTDRWMMGDRYGEVIKIRKVAVPKRGTVGEPNAFVIRDVATVKLDKSGKTIRVVLDECTEI